MNNQKAYSTFWLKNFDQLTGMYNDPSMRTSPEYIIKLSQVRRGIANFVRIVTGRDIPVHFSTGKDSYAAKDQAGREFIVISATADPTKFDANVGTALHEAAHIVLSNKTNIPESTPLFPLLHVLGKQSIAEFVPPVMLNHAARLNLDPEKVKALVKKMINFLEDRRIDQWMYQNAIGYRGYYDRMYETYWLNPKISALLMHPKTHVPLVKNYMFHTINMMNHAANPTYLPGLEEIWELVDLDNITRFNNDPKWDTWKSSRAEKFEERVSVGHVYPLPTLPEIVATAIRIVGIILKNAEKVNATPNQDQSQFGNVQSTKGSKSDESDVGSDGDVDPDNWDVPDETFDEEVDAPNPYNSIDENGQCDENQDQSSIKEKAEEKSKKNKKSEDSEVNEEVDSILDQQEKFLDGDVEKEYIDRRAESMVSAMESSQAELKVIDGDFGSNAKVIVYKRLTTQLISSPSFIFSKTYGNIPKKDPMLEKAINEGSRMGNLLAQRLQVMVNESPISYTRRPHGKIDKRLLAGLGVGDEKVFKHIHMKKYSPVLVHLSVDASFSMRGEKWYNAMRLATALAKAADKIRNLEVVISLRGGDGIAHVVMAHDSRVDSFINLKRTFPYLMPVSGTPEGLCFAAIKEQILSDSKRSTRKYFVNISDGEPWFTWDKLVEIGGNQVPVKQNYQGEPAWHHTAQQVHEIKMAGILVLSYFVCKQDESDARRDHLEAAFKRMYGKSAKFIDTTSVTYILSTLNELFLTK